MYKIKITFISNIMTVHHEKKIFWIYFIIMSGITFILPHMEPKQHFIFLLIKNKIISCELKDKVGE